MSDTEKDLIKERQKAIKLYLSGKSVTDICDKLNRSRRWFYKWKNRYEAKGSEWYKSKSKAPKSPASIDSDMENLIIKIRKELMKKEYAQIGAQAIAWKLKSLGIDQIPSLSTISRVIKRNELVVKRTVYQKKGTDYPKLPVWFPNSIHEVDFWGPRYITGGAKFYVFNVMDVYSRRVCSLPARKKRNQEAIKGLIKTWKTMNEPDFIKFDNALQFRGSNKHPRSFGPVIRLCLKNGIQPIFIPKKEPWRNGHIEKFHDSLQKRFYNQIEFESFNHFCNKLDEFIAYHNAEHRYSPLNGATPDEVYSSDCLGGTEDKERNYNLSDKIPLRDGHIHVVRLIRSDLKLDIFTEKFSMPEELKYQYVVATICTDVHMIRVHDSDWNSLFTIPYRLT